MHPIHLPHDHSHINKKIQTELPKESTFLMVSDLFKLLSEPKRLQIFWLLCHCEECVVDLSVLFEITSPAVSHHLKLLKADGLVVSRREGKEVYYTAADNNRCQALHDMIEQMIEIACPFNQRFEEVAGYDSNVQTIREVHDFLTHNLGTRYSIDELANRFHMNKTTLKSAFKDLYGQPIATYMKEYRMRQAREYLAHSNLQIGNIALLLGYENQSKFSQAFKDVTGLLPKDYRKERI